MVRRILSLAWWRGVLAASLVLAALAPPPPLPVVPDWLAAAICHAPGGSDGPSDPHNGVHVHVHCALCQVAQAVALPPVIVPIPLPHVVQLAAAAERPLHMSGTQPRRPYASRAPPQIG